MEFAPSTILRMKILQKIIKFRGLISVFSYIEIDLILHAHFRTNLDQRLCLVV